MRRYMDDAALWPPEGRLLVAVSGGPDSAALLLILARLARRPPLSLAVAHFDHGLRGAAVGETEALAVRRLAESLDLPFFPAVGDVRRRAKQERLSLEEAARRERYEFLAAAAREAGAAWVATGHTASDQAETVLLHLLRGAGLAGLAGMSPSSGWPVPGHDGLTLIRPLLRLSRDETLAYCVASGVRPLDDASNRSSAFLRNRVRHDLLPHLRDYNRRIDVALVRLADAARTDLDYLEDVASLAVEERGEQVVSLSRALLAGWPVSLRRHAFRLALERLVGDLQGFGERHVLALERLLADGTTGDRLDLPRSVAVELARDAVELRLDGSRPTASLPDEPVALPVPGQARFGPLIVAAAGEPPGDGSTSVEVDAEAVASRLCIRRRRPGDRFQPLGLSQAKKLQDFFVDAHLRQSERDSVPLFESAQGIVWVGGLRIADWARPRAGRPTVHLSYRRIVNE